MPRVDHIWRSADAHIRYRGKNFEAVVVAVIPRRSTTGWIECDFAPCLVFLAAALQCPCLHDLKWEEGGDRATSWSSITMLGWCTTPCRHSSTRQPLITAWLSFHSALSLSWLTGSTAMEITREQSSSAWSCGSGTRLILVYYYWYHLYTSSAGNLTSMYSAPLLPCTHTLIHRTQTNW